MKVIVKQSGFYAGRWREASDTPVDMADKVAKYFLAPFGDSLEAYVEGEAVTTQPAPTEAE